MPFGDCANVIGFFICECFTGFVQDASGMSCTGESIPVLVV